MVGGALGFGELVLAGAAEGAGKVVGEILELGAGRDAVVGIADGLVVLPAAEVSDVFHGMVPPSSFFSDIIL